MGNEGLWDRQLVKVIKKNIGTFQQIAEWANNNPEGDRRMDMTTKQELQDFAKHVANSLATLRDMIDDLDATQPQPEPETEIERNYVLLGTPADGQPEITVDIPENPGTPYFALTSIEQAGPDNNIAILVTDADGTPLNDVPIEIWIEGTDFVDGVYTGNKGPGLIEYTYDRNLWGVRVGGSNDSDIVRHITTNRSMPDDQPKDMVNGHIRLELIFRKVR